MRVEIPELCSLIGVLTPVQIYANLKPEELALMRMNTSLIIGLLDEMRAVVANQPETQARVAVLYRLGQCFQEVRELV